MVQFNQWRKIDISKFKLGSLEYYKTRCSFIQIEIEDKSINLLDGFIKDFPCLKQRMNMCNLKMLPDGLSKQKCINKNKLIKIENLL